MVKKLLPGRAFYVFFALLLVCAGNSFVAAQSGDSVGKRDKIIDDNWKLISAGNKTVESLADLTHGVYFLELSGTRLDCDKPSPQEYLGFNNRTCSASLASKTTSGPVMRGRSMSMMWRQWIVRVYESTEEQAIISLQAFIHPDVSNKARCLGFVSNFYDSSEYEETCARLPYGNGIFLNENRDNSTFSPQKWTVKSAEGTNGGFEIIASNKPNACLRMLAAKGCASQPILVESPVKYDTGSQQYTAWKFVKGYDLVPDVSPPPLSPPSVIPLVPTEIPGPKISAPSSTSSGNVDVVVESLGGSDACSVVSITLVSVAGTIGATPNEVEVSASRQDIIFISVSVPVSGYGYNKIYAFGVCSTGEKTEISNQLSVFHSSNSDGSNSTPTLPAAPKPPPGCYPSNNTFKGTAGLALHGNTLFIADFFADEVISCEIFGTELTGCQSVYQVTKPVDIRIAGTQPTAYLSVYSGQVYRCSVSGSSLSGCKEIGQPSVDSSNQNAGGIAINQDQLFFTAIYMDKFYACEGATQNSLNCVPTVLFDPSLRLISNLGGMAIHDGNLFMVDYSYRQIVSCPITPTGLDVGGCVVNNDLGLNQPINIGFVGDTAYVTNQGYSTELGLTGHMSKCTVQGTNVTDCVAMDWGIGAPGGLAVDEDKVVVATSSEYQILPGQITICYL